MQGCFASGLITSIGRPRHCSASALDYVQHKEMMKTIDLHGPLLARSYSRAGRRGALAIAAIVVTAALSLAKGAGAAPAPAPLAAPWAARERLPLNAGWRFHAGDPAGTTQALRYDARPDVGQSADGKAA